MDTKLRNQFAAAAITGMANTFIDADDLAARAWSIAEAMMRKLPADEQIKPESKYSIAINGEIKPPQAVAVKKKAKAEFPALLEFINHEGIDSREIQRKYKERYKKSISYSQVIYQLNKLAEKGKVKIDKATKPFLWYLVQETDKAVKHDPDGIDEKKLAFAQYMGFKTIADAVSGMGPFEFSEAFGEWKPGKKVSTANPE